VFWAIALTLFFGALGFPIPENPILMGGGYTIFKQISPFATSLALWYLAILSGDTILFAVSYWFFNRPALSAFLKRYVGTKRLASYEKAFASRGGWTLFLARFTYGIRAVAYIAAGAAHYPWRRFLVVDALSVAIQVPLFVGVGYFAGERIELAAKTGEKIFILIGIFAFISLIATWMSILLQRKISLRNQHPRGTASSDMVSSAELSEKASCEEGQGSPRAQK
jgi:membrane protein DedA with SNARE-associated domain